MTRRSVLIVCGVSLLVFVSRPAFALDLNGTNWVGTFVCKGVSATGEKDTSKLEDLPFGVSQTGSDAVVTVIFPGGNPVAYDARVINDAASPDKKGSLSMAHPGTNPDAAVFSELVWGPVTHDEATGKGTFKGTGVRMGAPFGAQTCKWTFKTVIP